MYEKILLAYDGSVEGRHALHEGVMLARLCGAEVFLLAVVNLSTGVLMAEGAGAAPVAAEHQHAEYRQILTAGLEHVESVGISTTARLEYGNPAEQISAVAREIGADLVIVGHRRQSALARWWGGSVGASLLEQLGCSLLVAQHDVDEL